MKGRDEMNDVVKKNLRKMGHKATDKVTRFTGVVTSMSFDLYGCVQAVVVPTVEEKSHEIKDSRYFDVARLEIDMDDVPVMPAPTIFTEDDDVVMENLKKLGYKVTDKVTGLKGVITCVSFDLYGCVQTIVQPGVEKDSSKIEDSKYFDITRLDIDPDSEPVMAAPKEFTEDKGPANKPSASMR